MLKLLIEKLITSQNLTEDEMHSALEEILVSENPEQIAAFLMLLRAKGETAEELYALVQGMRSHMTPISYDSSVLDIVGTGGDNSNTVNISSASAIVAAACGAKVLKHGNRSVSSKCGSADFIESLGINLMMPPEQIIQCLDQVGIAFAFAPAFHPSMKKVMPIRRSLGMRTIFNFLGPLLNPASPSFYLMGVFDEDYMPLFADVLMRLSVQHAMVVHSAGLDELSLLGPSVIIEIKGQEKTSYTIQPDDFALEACALSDIQGGDVDTNRELLLEALAGGISPIADTIALNAGAALYVANQAESIAVGVGRARDTMRSRAVLQIIDDWVAFSQMTGEANA